MKKIILSLLVLCAGTVQAATVHSGNVDFENKSIELNLSYGGGCVEHKFELSAARCTKSIPASCTVKVLDVTEELDICDAIPSTTVKFSFDEMNIFPGRHGVSDLTVLGDNDSAVRLNLIYEPQVKLTTRTSLMGPYKAEDGKFLRAFVTFAQDGTVKLTVGSEVIFEGLPKLVRDQRPADGPLVLNLGGTEFYVGSGFNRTGLISYTLVYKGQNVQLEANTFINIIK